MRDLLRSAKTPEEMAQVEAWINEELAALDEPDSELEAGIAHGNAALERQNARTALTQEVGPLPPIKDPARRARCKYDLRAACLTYFQPACYLGLSPYQEEMVAALQYVTLNGGKKSRAVRRGGLKSTLGRIDAAWGVLNGHRKFMVLVGATDPKSDEHRENLLKLMMTSTPLMEDFPELRLLYLKWKNPKKGIRLDGEIITVTTKDERGCIVFPEIPGIESSGAKIAAYSINSTDASGLATVDATGRTVRPDQLIFDDVQTPQSAKSYSMTIQRENAITTTFMGMAGLGETMAAVNLCTVREENDLSMRFCDREIHPDWDGRKYPVLIKEPKNKKPWDEYAELLKQGATPEEGFAIATAFYVEHRTEMDEGAEVAWELDKEKGYVSALQWAMTIKIRQPAFFRAELQQEGNPPVGGQLQLSPDSLIKRLSRVQTGIVPTQSTYLTAFVDSSDHVLWWMVCAWRQDFSGWIVDCGTWPDQRSEHFRKEDLPFPLEMKLPGKSWEEAFVHAHNELEQKLFTIWRTEDEQPRELDLCLKDWSDGDQSKLIESQVFASQFRTRIRPSKGFAPKPGTKRLHQWGDDNDRQTGSNWVERRSKSPIHTQFDANAFKTLAVRRLLTTVGAPSAVLLPGTEEHRHTLLAEHFTAERAIPIKWGESTGIVWDELPGRDNDWFDCFVGNCVAASMLGCCLPGETISQPDDDRPVMPLPPGFIRGGKWNG